MPRHFAVFRPDFSIVGVKGYDRPDAYRQRGCGRKRAAIGALSEIISAGICVIGIKLLS